MELYFAPMEGITTATYRNIHNEMFGGCDGYYAPFITPSDIERISIKSLRDILPERNVNINLKIQVLTSLSESFFKFAKKVEPLGYKEININLGCPSGTVVKKGRGSGFLRNPDGIDRFLYEIFECGGQTVSLKTRIGFDTSAEMDRLMDIYNKYPLSLLIIHPRTRMDFYNGEPDMEVFEKAYNESLNKVCYNGNVFSKSDYDEITNKFTNLHSIMLGRGAIKNPALFREIKGGAPLETRELIEFTERLADKYLEVLGSDYFTLGKLKEIWMYMMWNFPEEKKLLKSIKKASKLSDLIMAVQRAPEIMV